jgi:nitrate reductase assembly molybdenum cofactor insertion protein NarJ
VRLAPGRLRPLADVLAYPRAAVAATAAECAAELANGVPAAAERLARFAAWARAAGVPGLEEAYTSAFDLAPVASPYVGDLLFGATRERSLLLAGLAGLRREAGLPDGEELADHVAEVLRLVAADIPADVRDDLVAEGLAPALRKMLAALEEARHPYADAVAAAIETIEIEPRAVATRPRALEVLP